MLVTTIRDNFDSRNKINDLKPLDWIMYLEEKDDQRSYNGKKITKDIR